MDDDDEDDSQVGSPSPPYEGVIIEEPEKQLESRGGVNGGDDINGNETTEINTNMNDEVNSLEKASFTHLLKLFHIFIAPIYFLQSFICII